MISSFLTLFAVAFPALADDYKVRVIGGSDDYISYWKSLGFWGIVKHESELSVPRSFVVGSRLDWKAESDKLPVEIKKEIFYRAALPLIVLANERILADREQLTTLVTKHKNGVAPGDEDKQWLHDLATRYRLSDQEDKILTDIVYEALLEQLIVRVDIIPASLALGQAAYESGYDTSRFARQGNAFFGQWTWGEKGLRPLEQRGGKGDYKVAAYDWPLDSVRGYMRNLNTQRTYADLRAIRAEMRRNGETPSGYDLAAGLGKYSEKGQTYIDTLRGIMKKNKLLVADRAYLRDETPVLIFEAASYEDKLVAEREIENLRASGELDRIVSSMRLDE